MSRSIAILFTAILAFGSPAHAHLGHVGELAGHAHWVGIGALAAAAVLTAIVAKTRKKAEEVDAGEDSEAGDGEESAGA